VSDVTRILEAAQQGDPKVVDELLPLVYEELGDQQRVDIQELEIVLPADEDQLLAVSEALDALAVEHKAEAELVKLRYFVGMTNDEAAVVLGIAPRPAKYYWTHAQAWLFREITSRQPGASVGLPSESADPSA
jgi:hypothetical protein